MLSYLLSPLYDIQKEYTRNTMSSPRSIRTSNYAIVFCMFLDFICGAKFGKAKCATFGRLLLNRKRVINASFINNRFDAFNIIKGSGFIIHVLSLKFIVHYLCKVAAIHFL